MNVLALNPPFHARYSRSQRSPAVIKSGVIYYPLWLAYATGVLEQDGFRVKLVDAPATGLGLGDVLELADEWRPRLVVVDTSTPSIYSDVETAMAIKSRMPRAFVLLAGPHVSALPEESLQISPAVDAVVRGEYDYTVRDVARVLDDGGDLSTVLGLTYRDRDGSVVTNEARPPIEDLDALPFVSKVYKRHLHVEDYFYSIARYPEVTLITGRGCSYRCTYCLWPQTITGHRHRQRSVTNIANEFEFIAHEFPQVKEVFIEDDTFTLDQERCIALAKELIQRDNRLPFTANSRANISFETLSWLHQAGLRLLCVGFESGNQAVLDGKRKAIKVERFFRFREDAQRAGVLVHGCFMAGGPGETKESLDETLQLAKKLKPDTAQFFPLMVYPGTEAYRWAKDNGHLTTEDFREWLTPDGLHCTVIQQPGLSAQDLVDWCDRARRSFYLRPSYMAAKIWEIMTRPAEAGRIVRAARAFLRYLLRPSLSAEEKEAQFSEERRRAKQAAASQSRLLQTGNGTGIHGLPAAAKRLMDIAGALVVIPLSIPMMIGVALAIKLTSPGPVLFVQERMGERGRVFKMFKFRTMVENAEEMLDQLIDLDALEEPVFKLKDDPRVTSVGRFLRRWSLDELPQFFSVLKGEMSLVGPRPEEVRIVRYYSPWHRQRLMAKPGVTGPVQIGGRGDLGLEERVRLEVDYIRNYSIWTDLKILLKTIPAVMRGNGSY
jgi:anaerobic magnesium-protoporphyrin IX monomethyl ester cyclase